MKKRLNPTEILLKELPPEGRDYEYDQESGELTPFLEELVGKNPYRVTMNIRPIGNAYDVQGTLKTGLNLQCSLCAVDFALPIDQKFHDVVVINEAMHKGDTTAKTNHSSEWDESQPEGLYLDKAVLDVKEFIHELIALAEPIRPLGGKACDEGKCENLMDRPKREWLSLDPNDTISVHNHPFAALGKVKLKS
jgi:uncharacterized metal-binding protein YceD (DUF177 family)